MADNKFNPSEDYVDTVKNMNSLYEFWNEAYFNCELIAPVITVRQDMRGRSLGWFVPHRVWMPRDGGEEGSVEINMCSQWLDRPMEEIAGTMLHEMCHHYAHEKGIKDTSRFGYYHNKEFKKIAVEHGLEVKYAGSYHGWCETELTEEAKLLLKQYVLHGRILYDIRARHDPDWFTSAEGDETSAEEEGQGARERKPSSTRKYICPKCGMSVRATRQVNILCGDCNEKMIAMGLP